MKQSLVFEQFNSPVHRQWKKDRALRQRLPLNRSWRGCLGLAMLLQNCDETQYAGSLALLPNSQVSWLALRDIPVGHFPGSRSMNRRDVNYASLARAWLHHGMPRIDFAQSTHSWDFRRMPFGEHRRDLEPHCGASQLLCPGSDTLDSDRYAREFEVLNRLSQQMTAYASGGASPSGWSMPRVSYHPSDRPAANWPSSRQWMPRPYLAFAAHQAPQLYWLATTDGGGTGSWECPTCRQAIALEQFRHSGDEEYPVRVLEKGEISAACTYCGKRRKWFLEDLRPRFVRRRFGNCFREEFCRAAALGLPLGAVGPEVYCGVDVRHGASGSLHHCQGPKLAAHLLKNSVTGNQRIVFLPTCAQLLVKVGQKLDAGESWVKLIADPPASWLATNLHRRWSQLPEISGGRAMVGVLQQLWFMHQAVWLEAHADQLLFPAELVAAAVRGLHPLDLWWDIAPSASYLDGLLESAVFPPLQQRSWTQLRFALAGDVNLDASINDNRFRIEQPLHEKAIIRSPGAPTTTGAGSNGPIGNQIQGLMRLIA